MMFRNKHDTTVKPGNDSRSPRSTNLRSAMELPRWPEREMARWSEKGSEKGSATWSGLHQQRLKYGAYVSTMTTFHVTKNGWNT